MVTGAGSVACSRVVKEIATGPTLATARKTLKSRQVVVISVGAVETSTLRRAPSEVEQWDPVVRRVCLVLSWSASIGQSEETEGKRAEVKQRLLRPRGEVVLELSEVEGGSDESWWETRVEVVERILPGLLEGR